MRHSHSLKKSENENETQGWPLLVLYFSQRASYTLVASSPRLPLRALRTSETFQRQIQKADNSNNNNNNNNKALVVTRYIHTGTESGDDGGATVTDLPATVPRGVAWT